MPLSQRQTLMEAIDTLKRGDILLCTRSDRLSRSAETLFMIKALVYKRGATIEFTDGTNAQTAKDPATWIQSKMLETLAEYEKVVLSSRIRRAYVEKRKKGECLGFIPYGYRKKGIYMVEDESEQMILRVMVDLYRRGETYAAITRTLNDQKIFCRKGTPWKRQNVTTLLKRMVSLESDNLSEESPESLLVPSIL